MTLAPGLRAELLRTVTTDDTAIALGSGDVPVLATPRAIAWAEAATCAAVADHLDASDTTVGIRVAVEHRAPTAVGERVVVTATLRAVDRRRIDFDVEVRNADGASALTGSVTRVRVERQVFLS